MTSKKKTCFVRVKYPNGYDTIEEAFQLNQVKEASFLKRSVKSNLKTDSLVISACVLFDEKTGSMVNVLTGSIDLNFLTYCSVVSKMEAQIEDSKNLAIESLKEMTIEFFKMYMEKNGSIPKVIIFYRNGLHLNDEKLITHKKELQLLKKAFSELNGDVIKPSITFIVVADSPGTIYYNLKDLTFKTLPDGLATEPLFSIEQYSYTREFYLSSIGNQECRPYRYRIIIDENYLKQEILMDLTYKLCFVFLDGLAKFECPCAILYSNYVADKLISNQLSELEKELDHGLLKRLNYIEFSPNLTNKNIDNVKKSSDFVAHDVDLAEIYQIIDPYEEDNDIINLLFIYTDLILPLVNDIRYSAKIIYLIFIKSALIMLIISNNRSQPEPNRIVHKIYLIDIKKINLDDTYIKYCYVFSRRHGNGKRNYLKKITLNEFHQTKRYLMEHIFSNDNLEIKKKNFFNKTIDYQDQ
ncbi:argonaute [Brachionus plicatilis]|uniref:Argonaute n=1 Tax=Brachionus plicatilis TaxID=10195 RepID=A0A3M7SV03_BRAPC|nr:argonaute [Brachionus plicatilis]